MRRVLLLDCGTGDGLALLAAATGHEVWGATAHPEDAALARGLLGEAGLDAPVLEGDGAALAARPDLPAFDLIAMPSGWTRLSAAGRAGVAALLARRLAPGGAFLLTRETLPGSFERAALRRVLRHCLDQVEAGGDDAARVGAALDLAHRLTAQSHLLVRILVNWEAVLAWVAALPPEVALREWFAPEGPAWTAGETDAALAAAGFAAACAADPFGAPAELTVTPEQRALIEAADGPAARAETETLLLGDDRRCELRVRPGGAPVALGALRFARTAEPWDPPLRPAAFGDRASLDPALHEPVFAALEAAGGIETVAALAARLGRPEGETAERLRALTGAGVVAPAAEDGAAGAAARAASARLNAVLLARETGEALAAPALGGAMPVSPGIRSALARGEGREALVRLGAA